jgi:hypothetical protein
VLSKPALLLIAVAACAETTPIATDVEESAVTGNSVTTVITVNGEHVFAILFDESTQTNGFLNASRDNVSGTSAMDFSYATPSTDPNIVIVFQGAGEIPNSALDFSSDTATLDVTTPFDVVRCEVNQTTGDFVCLPTAPITFDLTWVVNGFSRVHERIRRKEVLGPITTKTKSEVDQRSALVNGTFNGHVATDNQGNLLDTEGRTVTREITRRLSN